MSNKNKDSYMTIRTSQETLEFFRRLSKSTSISITAFGNMAMAEYKKNIEQDNNNAFHSIIIKDKKDGTMEVAKSRREGKRKD